ncbi:hypothetical protein SAY86_024039 [Trapa natans]|uniref:Uncharacterized protein n=1 Tax=Trapa natans TaxID=22666 RepID=A0AAN7LYF9_TRANT|nr:hypothetical protein SAY86_024039 [Trapa natans]
MGFCSGFLFTNNVLSTAQQVWLRKLGGAKPMVNEDASGIITAGRAKRVGSEPARPGERFRPLKDEEKKSSRKASAAENVEISAPDFEDDGSDDESNEKGESVLEETYAASASKQLPDYPRPKRSKRSKRKRAGL